MNGVPPWRIVAACGVLAVLGVFAAVLAPIYFRNLRLQRYVAEITQPAENQTQPDDTLRSLVVNKAHELSLPVKADNVHILHLGGKRRIDVRYFVRVTLPGYTVDLHFNPGAAGPP